jgi:diguanylate cyclase (GGDEF)-like protein
MRLVGRQDVPVLLGLVAALLLTFLNPLSRLVGTPSGVPAQFALAALPGFLLMAGVLAFGRWRDRSALQVVDAQIEASAREAETRGHGHERFTSFTRALARSVDADAVTSAINDYLAPLAGTPGVSVLLSSPAGWEVFAGDRSTADELLARVDAADDALTGAQSALAGTDASFPLRVGGQTIGLLVVRRDRRDLEPDTVHALEGAASVLAVAVKNLQLFRELQETSLRDALTGCASRAHGLDVIDGELRRARRSHLPVSLVLVDVDHLKEINSRHGYLCGDAALAMIGRRLRELLRRSDLKVRYGGEEFVVLLPETALIGARRVAETLRREIADRPMPWNGEAITVTASFGVTQVLPGEVNVDAIIARAESAACRAQEEGHNTVRVASDTLVSLDKSRRSE